MLTQEAEIKWDSTVRARKRSVVMSLYKRDLIEALETMKVANQGNQQHFLLKTQFVQGLSYTRILELNEQLQT